MSIEVITKEDLREFKIELLGDIKELLQVESETNKKWLRSPDVRKLLKISAGTLQNLRITQKLKPQKVGGILYYEYSEIENLLSGKS